MTIEEAMAAAIAHHKEGRLGEAEALYRAVLEVAPDHPGANYLLGIVADETGHKEAAVQLLETAIRLRGDIAAYHGRLAGILARLGRSTEALAAWRRTVELDPGSADAWIGIGELLSDAGHNDDALAHYDRALSLRPDSAEIRCNTGGILRDLGRFDEAIERCRQALALRPDLGEANYNMALNCNDVGLLDEAIACYHRTLEQLPHLVRAHSSLLTSILYHPGWDPEKSFAEHRRFEAMHARRHYPEARRFANQPDPDRRLRIGYLSGDLFRHPVGRNLLPLIEAHNDDTVALCFYANVARPDEITDRFRHRAETWRDIRHADDDAVAGMMREDGIDILLSLAGRFDLNRPLVVARRPAPIQVSFHDPATSGLEVMDYLIADPILAPRHGAERFTERPLRLPSFYLHDPIDNAPDISPRPPMERTGHVTFGSCNNPAKLSDDTLALWAEVMAGVPDSRLVLKYKNWFSSPTASGRVMGILEARGVSRDRVELVGETTDLRSHLGFYDRFDIALDPFPFNGSTTTFEALWMGIPVVTLLGRTMVSRWAASILTPLGLSELIAASPSDYVETCRRLAGDAERLAAWRRDLRGSIKASPICDGALRARQMERLYRAMWKRWCRDHDR